MRREGASVIFAISSLSILFILSNMVSPEKISLTELRNHEGDIVVVEGIVKDIHPTSGGNTVLILVDESGEGKVFAYGKREIFVGDRIEVIGRVQRYREEFEVIADRISKLESKTVEVKIWQLAEDPEEFLNRYVNVAGKVREIKRDFVEIEDDGYTIRATKPLIGELSEGDEIWVKGKLLYSPKELRYYFLSIEVKKIG